MADYDLTKLSPRDFEHLVQALATKVIGPGIRILGDGRDGAREATFEGPMPMYPVPGSGWDGYLVLQVKHCQRPTGDTGRDGAWVLAELSKELAKFKDEKRALRRPQYYIFATNLVLTPVWQVGTQDKAFAALREETAKLGLKAADLWDYDRLCRYLDAHADVRNRYAHLLSAGDVIGGLSALVGTLGALPAQLQTLLSVVRLGSTADTSSPQDEGSNEVDAKAEIDRAGRYLEQGKIDVASDLLDEAESEFGSRLSPRARYRLQANRGHILQMRGDVAGAARLYIEAKQFQPHDKDARFNEALAHLLLGEIETARRLATDLKRDFPEYARTSLIEIVVAPTGVTHAELLAALPSPHRENGEVMAALARRAVDQGASKMAEEYARSAHALEPKWVEPKLILADVIVESTFGEGGWTEPGTQNAVTVARLREAEGLFNAVLEQGELIEPVFRTKVRLDRAAVYEALGDHDRARAEFLSVYKSSPDIPDAVLRYAAILAGDGRAEDGIAALEPSVGRPACPPQLLLLYVQLIADRNRDGDRAHAADLLRGREEEWPNYPKPFRIAWVQTFVHLLLGTAGADATRAFLDGVPADVLPREISLGLRARAEQAAGDADKAAQLADEAAQAVTATSRPDDIRRLALMLQNMSKPEKALPLWQRVVAPGRLTADTRLMLRCAQRCGEEDFIIDACAGLRRDGHLDPECLDLEIATLGRRSPQAAATLIRELLDVPADESLKRFLRLRLSHIGLYTKQPDLIEKDAGQLPAVGEVTAQLGRAVVGVLVHGPTGAAAPYAYELYRRYPDDFDAHMAVIESSGLFGGRHEPQIEKPKVVRPGCAVCIQPTGKRKREWWIIEEGPNPSVGRNERPANDPIVQRMLGKSKGETFIFRTEPLPVEAKIVSIEDKFLYRWRDCFSGMETRFAHKSPIWSLDVGRGRGKHDFTEFFQELDRQAQKAKERDEWYKTQNVPLAMFAKSTGKTILEATLYVASTPALPIRCCKGSQDEVGAALIGTRACTRLVIDGSALATLFLSGTSGWLERVPVECVVTEHTLYEFRRLELLHRPADKELVQMGKVGDQYTHEVWKPEHLRSLRERVESFIRDIETFCTITPGISLAPLLPEHREVLVDACGRDVAESIVTAASPNTLLWTDDRTVADLAKFSLKTQRTWTQAVFSWLGEEGIVPEDVREKLAVDLVAAGYVWTRLSAREVLLAGAEAAWDVEHPRFAATLQQLASAEVIPQALAFIAGNVLAGVFQRGLSKQQENIVAFRVLRLLDSRPNGRRLIEIILQHLLRFFSGDSHNARRAAEAIRIWTEINRRNSIIVPGPLS